LELLASSLIRYSEFADDCQSINDIIGYTFSNVFIFIVPTRFSKGKTQLILFYYPSDQPVEQPPVLQIK
jgi:hypothetical protein